VVIEVETAMVFVYVLAVSSWLLSVILTPWLRNSFTASRSICSLMIEVDEAKRKQRWVVSY
jgi:hypothetical protein